jgi:hypothetical protein
MADCFKLMPVPVAMKRVPYRAFALLEILRGNNFIFTKWAAEEVLPSQIVLLRTFCFLPIFLFAAVLRKQQPLVTAGWIEGGNLSCCARLPSSVSVVQED